MSSTREKLINKIREKKFGGKDKEAIYLDMGRQLDSLGDEGCVLNYNGHPSEAIIKFNEIIAIIDGDKDCNKYINAEELKAIALSNLGLCYQELGDFQRSREKLLLSIALNAKDPAALYRLAEVSFQLKIYHDADVYLEKARKLKNIPDTLLRDILYLWAANAINNKINDKNPDDIKNALELSSKLGKDEAALLLTDFGVRLYLKQERYSDALACYLDYCHSKQVTQKLMGYYHSGLLYMNQENGLTDDKKAFTQFKTIVDLYKQERDIIFQRGAKEIIASAAHNLAKYYDGERGEYFFDAEQVITAYQLAGELGMAQSFHDLGLKYDEGEDVESSLEIALTYYRKAAELGYAGSFLNLGLILLSDEKSKSEGLQWLKKSAEHKKTSAKAYYNLADYYFRQYNSASSPNTESAKKNLKNSYKYYKAGALEGHIGCLINTARMTQFGNGTTKDINLAITYYKQAAAMKVFVACIHLILIYREKLATEKELHLIEENGKALLFYLEQFGIVDLPGIGDKQKILAFVDDLKLQTSRECIAINKHITSTANNAQLRYVARIERILQANVAEMNAANIVTAIHSLGNLTEKSLDNRSFHQQQMPKTSLLITSALKALQEDRFNKIQLSNLIIGLSKLYLKQTVSIHADTIEALFRTVHRRIKEFLPSELVSIIYAATRLDVSHRVLREDLLWSLVKLCLEKSSELDSRASANFLYALSMLDAVRPQTISIKDYDNLITACRKQAAACQSSQSSQLTDDTFGLQQTYLAVKYFMDQGYSYSTAKSDELSRWEQHLEAQPRRISSSRLQNEIVEFIRPYALKIEEEKLFSSLPVDAFIILNNKQFKLQVNGPSHYLHGEGEPVMTLKSQFHARFLKEVECPVISIAYWEWPSQDNAYQHYQFLRKKLKAYDADLQPTRVNCSPGETSYVSVAGIFSAAASAAASSSSGCAVSNNVEPINSTGCWSALNQSISGRM